MRRAALFLAALIASSAALADGVSTSGVPNWRYAISVDVSYPPGPAGYGPNSMTTPVLWYTNFAAGVGGPGYSLFVGGVSNWNALVLRQFPSPIPARIANLEFSTVTAVVAGYYTFSLNVNGTSTALQCSIGQGGVNLGTTTQCSDIVDQVQINAGDLLSWQSTPSGSPTGLAGGTTLAATLVSANAQESLVGGASGGFMSATAIQYMGLTQAGGSQTTDALASSVMPTAGTLDRLYVDLGAAEPSGDGVQFTLFKNGVATNVQTNCLQATLCADPTNAVSVAAGDTLSVQMCPYGVAGCPVGVALANNTATFSLRFKPSVTNQAVVFGVPTSLPTAATTNKFMPIAASISATYTSDSNSQNIVPALATHMTLGNLMVAQCPGPDTTGAGGVTRTFTARMGGVNQSPTVAIIGNSTAACPALATGQDTTHTFQPTTAALLNLVTSLNTVTNASTLTELKTSMTATVP